MDTENYFLRVEFLEEFEVVGFADEVSMAHFTPEKVWGKLMKSIAGNGDNKYAHFYDVNIYDVDYFQNYQAEKTFIKFAGVKSNQEELTSTKMESLTIPKGHYAVFTHVGNKSEIGNTFKFIFSKWLPESGYKIDARPHFMILPSIAIKNVNYKEEIYIPLK
ncbi:MAG: GyrI-like domain-containing protein [Bacteroidota bacterium]